MNLSKSNQLLAFVTNVGVILGLILVAYELRQTQIAISSEVYATGREGWQNWGALIVENEQVADIWLRGNNGEELTPVEEERYKRLALDWVWIQIQMYDQWSRVDGKPADWVVHQLVNLVEQGPGLRDVARDVIATRENSNFTSRLEVLYPDFLSGV